MSQIRWVGLLLALGVTAGCGRSPRQTAPATEAPRVAAKATGVGLASTPELKDPTPSFRILPERPRLRLDGRGLQPILHEVVGSDRVKDWTAEASWQAEPAGIVEVEPAGGYLRAVRAGKARLMAQIGGHEVGSIEVVVDPWPESGRPWSFRDDVLPILTRQGCNSGGCHGKAGGQGGLALSFLGYDPEADRRSIAVDASSRGGKRIDPDDPESSLLLQKAAGQVPHRGGIRLAATEPGFDVIRDWIEAGAPERSGAEPEQAVRVTAEPRQVRLAAPGPAVVRVVASLAEGEGSSSERDVTRLASFRTTDDRVATVDDRGHVTLLRPGEADVIVRFGSTVLAVRVGAPVNPGLEFDFASLPRENVIDRELFRRLEDLKVPPSPAADDATFLRRVSLDLVGLQPLPDEIRAFLADSSADKRVRKVDELLGRREFHQTWLIRLGDLLQISSSRFPNSAGTYQKWLDQRLGENAGWDTMVTELLTATGDPRTIEGGAANYALDAADAGTRAEQTARRFLGLRLRCAQCHDHPFDVWTQDDYYHLAAFFAKVETGPGPGQVVGRPLVRINAGATFPHLRTKQPSVPALPGGGVKKPLDTQTDPRVDLAKWITGPGNPYFARATVNWVWSQMFGRGLVDPVDDLSAGNPPVHPELLDALAQHFVEHHFDLRDLIRTMAVSHAYGLASTTVAGNAEDGRLFSHHQPRPLGPYQMADALAQATDVPNVFGTLGKNKRALEVFDPTVTSTILDTFGRCDRTVSCVTAQAPRLSLRQTLLLIGGDVVNNKVASLNGYLSHLLEFTKEPADIVENLYLRTVCRPPTAEERSYWAGELAGARSLDEAAEDLFWALLNSREFAFNH
jgi:hypothetical protein